MKSVAHGSVEDGVNSAQEDRRSCPEGRLSTEYLEIAPTRIPSGGAVSVVTRNIGIEKRSV
jgi:hypothetical protein